MIVSRNADRLPAYIGKADPTPLGAVWVALSERGVVAVEIACVRQAFEEKMRRLGFATLLLDETRTQEATRQIGEYLDGKRRAFDLPVDWSRMTPFQRAVLQITWQIPYGKVSTYGEIACQVGKPRAARAVGRAQATNPMPLVIPCHRVIGSDGALHGYGAPGGLQTKVWLLHLEGALLPGESRSAPIAHMEVSK